MTKTIQLFAVFFFIWFGLNKSYGQEKLSESKFGYEIINYIKSNSRLSYLTESDIAGLYLDSYSYSKISGVTHVYLYQSYNAIKLYNAISNVALKNNKVIHFKDNFVKLDKTKISVSAPVLKPLQALQNVSSYLNIQLNDIPEKLSASVSKTVFSAKGVSQEPVPVELMYFKTKEGSIKLVWDMNVYTKDSEHWWSVRVDAQTGAVIDVKDWVIKCSFGELHNNAHNNNHYSEAPYMFGMHNTKTIMADGSQYNVLPLPVESPKHGAFQVVAEPAFNTASPFGWHDTNGASGAEYTITRGNNVWAQDDLDGDNNTVGNSPDGSSALNFNFTTPDFNQDASNYLDVATVNLFYHNNVVHDIFYQYGFDESSGNFQENNYGKGGDEGDGVIAQAQDGSGTDNANFATPPDGFRPRMQMFLFSPRGIAQDNLTISGGTIAGNYGSAKPSTANGADGPGNITGPSSTPVTAPLIVVNDGSAVSAEGCNAPLVNAADVSGKIAVILRGSCNFTAKIQNAQDAGAVGVIVANHNNPANDPNYTEYVNMYGVTDPAFTIPSIFINYNDGQTIINALNNGELLTATIVDNGPFSKDSSFDNGIVIHEYGHGISTRLTGGANNSGCLSNNFQMGEGWSDWFALMLTMKATDLGTNGRGIGTYAIGQETNGQGIRTRRYSTDFAINEYTFNATNDDRVVGQDPDTGEDIKLNETVHYIGTIWATMLWDLTWAYIDKYGFDPDLYTGTGGNNKVMQLVVEGLKLQGCDPDFIDGRDGLLAADTALTGGADQCLIWDVFAKRGLGFAASRGDAAVFNDQVEDFTIPDAAEPSLANCTASLTTKDINDSTFRIYPNPVSNTLTISSLRQFGDAKLELVDINGRQVIAKSVNFEGDILLDIKHLQAGLYILKLKFENTTVTQKIIKH